MIPALAAPPLILVPEQHIFSNAADVNALLLVQPQCKPLLRFEKAITMREIRNLNKNLESLHEPQSNYRACEVE